MMTYENAENDTRKKCRKWKIKDYSKLSKVILRVRSKCRKFCLQQLEGYFLTKIDLKKINSLNFYF
jgi:hypothetical protein